MDWSNVGLYAVSHPLEAEQRLEMLGIAQPITIGNNVWIGGNSTVLMNVTIGDNCVIGAGSVVTKSIPANCIAYGNPCKIIKGCNPRFPVKNTQIKRGFVLSEKILSL